MENTICPKVDKCPIFQGDSFLGQELAETMHTMYKDNFCQAGVTKYKTCKRFMASEELGVPIPKIIMPNSTRTIEEIRAMIETVQS